MSHISPGRAETEPVTTTEPLRTRDRAQSYLHRRLQSSGKPSHLQRAKDHVQSAIELKPPISFDHVLKREKKSANSSRRGSVSNLQKQQQDDFREWNAKQQARLELEERQRVTSQDVEKAKAENRTRADALQQRLNEIEETSMGYTQELDQTYYTMLERAAELRSTVAQLQTLLKSTTALSESFRDDTNALEKETLQTLDALDTLDEKEKSLDELVGRLQSSKADSQKLDQRLDAARRRVAEYESDQNATAKKRRQRWNATWMTVLIVITFIAVLLMLRNYQEVSAKLKNVSKHVVDAGQVVDDVIAPVVDRFAGRTAAADEDPYLHKLFDEL